MEVSYNNVIKSVEISSLRQFMPDRISLAHRQYFHRKCMLAEPVFDKEKFFQSDMRIVVDFLAEGDSYCSDRKVMHKAALIKMIKVLSGEDDISNVEEWMREQGIREEDEIKVCELFDQYERKGRREGLGITVSGYEEAKKYCS